MLCWFQAFLDLAHQHNISVHLYIHPYHASALQRIEETNNTVHFANWKKALVDLNRESATAAGQRPYPLCDFSPPSPITSEPLPWPDRPTAAMTNYFESSHFRKTTGDQILDRLLGADTSFGVWLEPPSE